MRLRIKIGLKYICISYRNFNYLFYLQIYKSLFFVALILSFIEKLKFIVFLKDVFLFSISAFGGPQGHLGMMIKTFVDKRKYLTTNELINFNIFCQLLPGATSTQTLLLIGYKRGGIFLAILTLIVWVLPASFIMGFLALFVIDVNTTSIWFGIFKYIQPMAIGFFYN
jgi:chromate transporter